MIAEAGQLAAQGYTEIQLLGQNVNSYRDPSPAGWDFATLLAHVRQMSRHPARALHDVASARFRQGDHRRHRCEPGAVQSRASAGAIRFDASAERDGSALHARRIHAAHRVDEDRRGATSRLPPTSSSGFPGETEEDFEETLNLLDEVEYDSLVQLSSTRSVRTRRRWRWRITFPKKRRAGAGDRAGASARYSDPPQRGTDGGDRGGDGGRDTIKPPASGSGARRRTRR